MATSTGLLAASFALLLLAGPALAASPAPAGASGAKKPAPSTFNQAVAAIQGADAPSGDCKLKVSVEASYKPGTTTVAGTVTVTNPTDAAINVRRGGGMGARARLLGATGAAQRRGRVHPFRPLQGPAPPAT